MAETFYDKERRPWDLSLTIAQARQINRPPERGGLGIDLQNPQHLRRLCGDEEALYLTGELIAVLCAPLVRATWPDRQTPEAIQEKVDTTLEDHTVWTAAYVALCKVIEDFCRRHGRPKVADLVASLPRIHQQLEADMAATAEMPPPTPGMPTTGTGAGASPERSATTGTPAA